MGPKKKKAATAMVPPAPPRANVLVSLRETRMVDSKPVLPAELLDLVLDYVLPADLIRVARTSRRMAQMVYDDSRWQRKLRQMGVWNEAQAKQRETEHRRRPSVQQGMNGLGTMRRNGTMGSMDRTLLDASPEKPPTSGVGANAGFELVGLDTTVIQTPSTASGATQEALTALSQVVSLRGRARQEFGKVYAALAPFYYRPSADEIAFSNAMIAAFTERFEQAKVLMQLEQFSRCDTALDSGVRRTALEGLTKDFEERTLQNFVASLERHDFASAKQGADVLVELAALQTAADRFIQRSPVITGKREFGRPGDCFQGQFEGVVFLGPVATFLEQVSKVTMEQLTVIDQVFPGRPEVKNMFLKAVAEQVTGPYMSSVLDRSFNVSKESYVRAVWTSLERMVQFCTALHDSQSSYTTKSPLNCDPFLACFEPQVEVYLPEELLLFQKKGDVALSNWEQQLNEQDQTTETLFMSNVSRQAAKSDFLSSFRKVVMAPVNVLPFPSRSTKDSTNAAAAPSTPSALGDALQVPSRTGTPGTETGNRAPSPAIENLPTTELAAKVAIMNARLENIRSLFSIEIALNIVHAAKSAIEHMTLFRSLSGEPARQACQQSEAVFIALLQLVGTRHMKAGFDTAIGHLATYNPRDNAPPLIPTTNGNGDTAELAANGTLSTQQQPDQVQPLVRFLELVNVGDLIQQMIDVFFLQELVAAKLIDADDFLSPAAKEKKRFEQMLDERVAAGLSKGIDALMDQVEFICATTQKPTDFNPVLLDVVTDISLGPTPTATAVVNLVAQHTAMLEGSTDKNLLDVFKQEVGVRLFSALAKHIKRQRISVDGAIVLISDMNTYSAFVATLKVKPLQPYFAALRAVTQIYLVDAKRHAKDLAAILADSERYQGIIPAEEVMEFAERRADWYSVRREVEKHMYGLGCGVM